jgi:ketosteroid isomerase-like protein
MISFELVSTQRTLVKFVPSQGLAGMSLSGFGVLHSLRSERNSMVEAALQELRATNRIFEEEVVGKGDFSALDHVYTTTARILPPGSEMVTGMENIRAFWAQAAAAMGVVSIQLKTVDLELLGETAVEIGRALIETGSGEVAVKYVVVWKREAGSWKWDIDIWNAVS